MRSRVFEGSGKESCTEKRGRISYEDLGPRRAEIAKIVNESQGVKSFYLRVDLPKPDPGQFLMVWLPGAEEVPMSISGIIGGNLRISVSREGPTTAKLHELKKGDALFVRGPFGKGFSLGDSCLLIGGGYGVAPLIFASEVLSDSGGRWVLAVGAKNASELLFVREARGCGEVHTATEDGSSGHRGVVTDLMGKLLAERDFDLILTCGPEKMMYEVLRGGLERGIHVQASLERYMKCGFGVCGSCVLDPIGMRVCADGPVFDGALLLKTEFGRQKRDASGARVPV